MRSLRCPSCSWIVQVSEGADPTCPNCGYGHLPVPVAPAAPVAVRQSTPIDISYESDDHVRRPAAPLVDFAPTHLLAYFGLMGAFPPGLGALVTGNHRLAVWQFLGFIISAMLGGLGYALLYFVETDAWAAFAALAWLGWAGVGGMMIWAIVTGIMVIVRTNNQWRYPLEHQH